MRRASEQAAGVPRDAELFTPVVCRRDRQRDALARAAGCRDLHLRGHPFDRLGRSGNGCSQLADAVHRHDRRCGRRGAESQAIAVDAAFRHGRELGGAVRARVLRADPGLAYCRWRHRRRYRVGDGARRASTHDRGSCRARSGRSGRRIRFANQQLRQGIRAAGRRRRLSDIRFGRCLFSVCSSLSCGRSYRQRPRFPPGAAQAAVWPNCHRHCRSGRGGPRQPGDTRRRAGIDHHEHVCVLLFRADRTDRARCVSGLAHPGRRARCSGAARRHRDRHPAIDWVDTPGWTPRPTSRIAAVPNRPCGDGPIPVVLARLCAVANRRARHRRLLEHADDLDSHRSATGDAITRDGDRDHVYRHWPGRCGDDRHPVGKIGPPGAIL